jgi:nucleotide-binding universal stress UspA family protein
MPTYVVPLDGSDFAERALRPAAALAARHPTGSARLLLLACAWPQDPPVEGRLEDRADLLRDIVDVDVRILTATDPAEGISQTLAAIPDSVLCMATHGRGAVRAAVLGSTAEKVLCHATEPVVLVGPSVQGSILPGERGRLVVCSDGSPFAAAILPAAAQWATELHLDPWLVEVIGPDEGVHEPGQPPVTELREEAEQHLADLAARLGPDGGDVHTAVLHGTPASRAISDFAADLPASLIAMATHGRTGLLRSALGSVASDVVRKAPCPVVLHRPAG